MRLLPTSICKPGMKLGKKIYNEEGMVLLSEHVELTDALLRRLIQHGIDFIYIEDSRTEDVIIPELVSDETRIAANKVVRSHFRRFMEDTNKKRMVQSFIGKDFRNMLGYLMDELSTNKDAMIMLSTMQISDNYLYQHSTNVCIYATMLGMSAGYSKEELMTMGLGALLHDIGKTKIDPKMLQKPGALTVDEFEEIKSHAMLGFQMLKDEPNIPLLSAHCALQHHERLDGSGYPRGLEGENIHEYARWIGLVDAYDAMTTHRVYRRAMLPHQALEILYAASGTQFDSAKVALFRDRVAIYPVGVTVRLNTGETGVVVDVNASYPHRPIVRILEDADGAMLAAPREVDLSKQLNIMIEAVNEFREGTIFTY